MSAHQVDMLLPEGVRIDHARRFATWRPRGVLTAAVVREVHTFVEAEERAVGAFQRFADLSALDGIDLSFREIDEIVQRRIETYQADRVKSAIFAPTPLAFGIARMYEQLMWRSPIEVCVFAEIGEAAEWLGVPVEFLTADS